MEVLLFILGLGAGWAIAHVYYKKSSDDLKRQFAREEQRFADLNQRFDQLQATLLKREQAGELKLDRDSKGLITDAHVIRIDTGALLSAGQTPVIAVSSNPPTARTEPTIVKTGD